MSTVYCCRRCQSKRPFNKWTVHFPISILEIKLWIPKTPKSHFKNSFLSFLSQFHSLIPSYSSHRSLHFQPCEIPKFHPVFPNLPKPLSNPSEINKYGQKKSFYKQRRRNRGDSGKRSKIQRHTWLGFYIPRLGNNSPHISISKLG